MSGAPAVRITDQILPQIWRRAWQPIPVFLPGEFQGQRSLAGPWWVHGVAKSQTQLSDSAQHTAQTVLPCSPLDTESSSSLFPSGYSWPPMQQQPLLNDHSGFFTVSIQGLLHGQGLCVCTHTQAPKCKILIPSVKHTESPLYLPGQRGQRHWPLKPVE